MGANFHFDQMLPTISQEAAGPDPKRQLELFTYGGKLFLRVGAANQENSGLGRYTVELSQEIARELASGLEPFSK